MNWQVVLSDIDIGSAEIEAVNNVLISRWLSMGNVTSTFEDEFAKALGVTQSVAVSSGTAALHLAALALGLGSGDEVILPSLSFVASASTVALTGARPVFAEVKGTWDLTIDPDDVLRRITPQTKAIIAVHYAGYPADMKALLNIAAKYGLAVIEDVAHAPLVQTDSGMLGTIGDVGCFSFFATKNMTTGEGGMLVARDRAILETARLMRSHCMTRTTWDKHQGRASNYDVTGLGFNYRMTEVAAAIGRIQLAKLPNARRQRQALTQQYQHLLGPLESVDLPFLQYEGQSAYHLFPILLSPGIDRSRFQEELKAQGIQTSVHFPPIHLFSFYRDNYRYGSGSLPITEDIGAREVSLPMHTRLSEADVKLVASNVHRILKKLT